MMFGFVVSGRQTFNNRSLFLCFLILPVLADLFCFEIWRSAGGETPGGPLFFVCAAAAVFAGVF